MSDIDGDIEEREECSAPHTPPTPSYPNSAGPSHTMDSTTRRRRHSQANNGNADCHRWALSTDFWAQWLIYVLNVDYSAANRVLTEGTVSAYVHLSCPTTPILWHLQYSAIPNLKANNAKSWKPLFKVASIWVSCLSFTYILTQGQTSLYSRQPEWARSESYFYLNAMLLTVLFRVSVFKSLPYLNRYLHILFSWRHTHTHLGIQHGVTIVISPLLGKWLRTNQVLVF